MFLDAKFTSFKGSQCYTGQPAQDPATGTCDASGQRLPNAPRLTYTADVQYKHGVGSGMNAEWLQALLHILNPQNQPGRLTLIHRFGVKNIERDLPPLLQAVRSTGQTVLWVCDPMHGNTESTASGLKTRHFDNILGELERAFRIHADMGSYLGGAHIELTGEDVTECIGGARGLKEADLARAYKSQVDPRLNYEQALELAMLIARHKSDARQIR